METCQYYYYDNGAAAVERWYLYGKLVRIACYKLRYYEKTVVITTKI